MAVVITAILMYTGGLLFGLYSSEAWGFVAGIPTGIGIFAAWKAMGGRWSSLLRWRS